MLLPSSFTKNLISKSKPLSKEEEYNWIQDYQKNKSEKSKLVLLNAMSKFIASLIYKYNTNFEVAVPSATFDDVFNQMVLIMFKSLDKFNFKKEVRLTTFLNVQFQTILNTPGVVMGTAFSRRMLNKKEKEINIDKPINDRGATIGSILPDGSLSLSAQFMDQRTRRKLLNAVDRLDRKTKSYIIALYGFDKPKKWVDEHGKITGASIAREEGLSQDIVQRKIRQGLEKIRGYLSESRHEFHHDLDYLLQHYRNK